MYLVLTHKYPHKKFSQVEEACRGLKEDFSYRAWPIMWALKVTFVILVLCICHGNSDLSLKLVMVVNLLYLVYVAVTRPFRVWIDKAVEIMNTIIFEIQLFMIWAYSMDEWSATFVDIFLSIIVLTIALNSGLIIGKF